MKRFLAIVITVLLTAGCVLSVFAAEDRQRVYDGAGLFTHEEAEELEKELNEAVDETGMDFVVLTTSDKNGASIRDYADDFYDSGGFGTDKDHSGILMLIDMEDRTVYLSTAGLAMRYLSDSRIRSLTERNDDLYEALSAGKYKNGVEEVIDGVRYYVRKGIEDGQYNYDEATGRRDYYKPVHRLTFFEILLSLAVPGLTAYLYTGSIKRQYAMEAEKKRSVNYTLAYRAASKYDFAVSEDRMLSHNVTSRRIPRSSHISSNSGSSGRSTIHRSHRGASHGGGGGRRHF